DFFKKRGKRQLKYMKSTTNLTPKTKRKRGRPKGLKTKKKKNLLLPPRNAVIRESIQYFPRV
ncbi:MAG: hypothetical protein ACTSXH_10010, partial [Promethearchaeota archaeon]